MSEWFIKDISIIFDRELCLKIEIMDLRNIYCKINEINEITAVKVNLM